MISVTILSKNSQKHLLEVLRALANFDEVLIYDNGSTDRTLEIAQAFPNVKIIKGEFLGFGPTHNKASSLAKNDWILSIDTDEVMTKKLVEEIFSHPLSPQCVYSIPRMNFYNNKWIKWCGWHPDRQLRLYNRQRTHFTNAQVHESIILGDLKHVFFKEALIHYSYESHHDFLAKMQAYSDLFAKQYCGKKSSSPCKAVLHGIWAFLKAYIIKCGFLGGYEGFVISVYNGNTAFYKYLKLYEAIIQSKRYKNE
jgi:glycosyltransferase involved in cell wall biosynthesis